MASALALGEAVSSRRRALLLAALLAAAPAARAELYYVIVGGLGGTPDYDKAFAEHATKLGEAAERTLGDDARVSVLAGSDATRDALRTRLTTLASRSRQSDRLVVFLIGHGSYDGAQYKFNLPGPDIDGASETEAPPRSISMPRASSSVLRSIATRGSDP